MIPKLIVVVAVLTVSSSVSAQWVRWETSAGGNGHWYKAVPNTSGISWEGAAVAANNDGGYLATITSAAENDFVFGLVNSPEFFTLMNGAGPALGGFQPDGSDEPAGGWSWVTGETWDYTYWYPGQPNNFPGGPSEERLQYFSGASGTPGAGWNDVDRDDTNLGGYVAEREDDPSGPIARIFTAVEVCWQAEANRLYQIQWTDSLTSTNWTDFGAPVLATDSMPCLFDSTRGQPRHFYRIQLLP